MEDSALTANAQADLNLRRAHMYGGTLSYIMAHIVSIHMICYPLLYTGSINALVK